MRKRNRRKKHDVLSTEIPAVRIPALKGYVAGHGVLGTGSLLA